MRSWTKAISAVGVFIEGREALGRVRVLASEQQARGDELVLADAHVVLPVDGVTPRAHHHEVAEEVRLILFDLVPDMTQHHTRAPALGRRDREVDRSHAVLKSWSTGVRKKSEYSEVPSASQ